MKKLIASALVGLVAIISFGSYVQATTVDTKPARCLEAKPADCAEKTTCSK